MVHGREFILPVSSIVWVEKHCTRGYSFLPCDTDFSVIETTKCSTETLYTPDDWCELVEQRFAVLRVKGYMIKKFAQLNQYFKNTTSKARQQFISKYKIIKYHKTHMNTVVISEDAAGTVWSSVVLEKPNIQSITMWQEKLYTRAIPVIAAQVAEISARR